MNIKDRIKVGLLIIVGLIVISKSCQLKADLHSKKQKIEAKPSVQYKDKEGLTNAKGEKTLIADFSLLKRLDTLLEEKKALERANSALKGKVKELTLLKNTVKVEKTIPTTVYIPVDTPQLRSSAWADKPPYIDTTSIPYPVYSSSFSDKHHSIEITASQDSTNYKLKIVNDFEISSSRKRSFLGLGRTKYFINVRSNNPYTDTLSLKNYTIDDKPSRLGFGLIGGYGMSKKGFSPVIGVGFNFKIF
jgi:hypothetical protein